MTGPDRRAFLAQAAGLAAGAVAAPLIPAPAAAGAAGDAADAASPPYLSLSPAEATFVEALVDILCPADDLTPNGVDCGLAVYIDRQLAGSFGKGDGRYAHGPFRRGKPEHGWQSPLTPEQFVKLGIAAADAACVQRHGKPFAALPAAVADEFLRSLQPDRDLADPAPPAGIDLAHWFNDMIYPLFVEGCFADPMYGGNRNAVFWRMIGYPGLPATHALDMVRYRGKPYPGAKDPKSIADFT